jgi:hypothetical protein
LCPCGSQVKYKRCHGAVSSEGLPEAPTLYERNIGLIGRVANVLGLGEGADWQTIKQRISGEEVRQIYEFQAHLWDPRSTNVYDVLPQPSTTGLHALYLGDVTPQNLLRNVYRFSLYADKIYIVDPFHNPWIMAAEFNPIENPDQYAEDTLKLAFFLFAMAPWIEAGLVQLIPDPSDFNARMKSEAFAAATARLGVEPDFSDEDLAHHEPDFKDEFLRTEFRREPEELRAHVIGLGMSEESADVIIAEAARRRKVDPLMLDREMNAGESQIYVSRAGANLEIASLICQLTGAFPYTDSPVRRRELESSAGDISRTADVWTPLTHAFRALEFSFLENVDSKFALAVRQSGRLSGFRNMLRRIWTTARDDEDTVDASVVRNFVDQLTEEYVSASSDYAGIKRDLGRAGGFGLGLAGAAAATADLTHGNLGLTIPLAGYTLTQVADWLRALNNRRALKKTPMSVFLDLASRPRKT